MRAATQTQTPEHRPSVGWAGCSSTPSHSMAAEKTKEAKAKSAAGGKKKVRRGPNAHRARRLALAQHARRESCSARAGSGAGRSGPPNSQRAVARRGAAPGRGGAPGRWAPAQLRATASMAAGRGLSRGADDAAFSSAPAHALSPAAFLGCGSCWFFWLGAGRRPAWLASAPATALSIVPAASLTPALRLISRRSGPRGR